MHRFLPLPGTAVGGAAQLVEECYLGDKSIKVIAEEMSVSPARAVRCGCNKIARFSSSAWTLLSRTNKANRHDAPGPISHPATISSRGTDPGLL